MDHTCGCAEPRRDRLTGNEGDIVHRRIPRAEPCIVNPVAACSPCPAQRVAPGLRVLIACLALVIAVFPATAARQASLVLRALAVERRAEPLGIDVARPRFSWVIDSDARDVRQASYRLVVSGPDGTQWDSGAVAGDASIEVEYAGPALAPGTRYTWTVEVRTNAGVTRASSWFRTGLFDDGDWGEARWIGNRRPPATDARPPAAPPMPAPLVRRAFEIDGDIAAATLYYAAGGYADFRVNGRPVNQDLLSPGFTDYDDTVQYVAVDLTARLAQGRNAIAAELGRGFYGMTGANVWRWHQAPWHDEPVVRALLRIEYADGRIQDVVTDDTWRIHDGPTRFDDLYAGETYDAAHVQPGYGTAAFDDAGWAAASVVGGPRGELVAQRQPPIRIAEELPATSIAEPVPGTYVIGFPSVIAGNVRVVAEGPAGTTIRFQYGEKLLASGLVDVSNNGGFGSGFQTDRFVLAGTGAPERWNARFSYKGFQYIQVSGWPGGAPPLSPFTALVVHTAAARTGSFTSAEPVMNATHEAVVRTLYNNLHGIPTDTPMFEKNGWTGDAALGAEMFLMNLDTGELFAKWMRDVHDSRRADGAPMVIAPSSADWGDWGTAPPWHSAYVLIPWWLYQYQGDRRVLDTHYDGMKAYVDLEYARSPGGIADSRLGDWVSPEASPAGGNAPEDTRVSATAFLYRMLRTMERIAEVRGRSADAAGFAARARAVQAAFNAEFLDPETGHYRGTGDRGYRQTHNVLALAFELAPDAAAAQRVADGIAADVRAKGTHLNTGALGTKYLLPVLTRYGHADLAYALAVQTSYPSWGYKLANGATTMWEHWAREARSRGHYFLGTIDDWFYHDVAGIRPDERAGWRRISIAPRLTGQLASARASLSTPYGAVSCSWQRTARGLQLVAQVPVGTTATVRIPAASAAVVRESGVPLDAANGVHSATIDGDAVAIDVGSGRYVFTAGARDD